jgi:hypothetical protein
MNNLRILKKSMMMLLALVALLSLVGPAQGGLLLIWPPLRPRQIDLPRTPVDDDLLTILDLLGSARHVDHGRQTVFSGHNRAV